MADRVVYQSQNWREIYIKILQDGPDYLQYEYAAELIDNGYANGKYLKNPTGLGDRITSMHWGGRQQRAENT